MKKESCWNMSMTSIMILKVSTSLSGRATHCLYYFSFPLYRVCEEPRGYCQPKGGTSLKLQRLAKKSRCCVSITINHTLKNLYLTYRAHPRLAAETRRGGDRKQECETPPSCTLTPSKPDSPAQVCKTLCHITCPSDSYKFHIVCCIPDPYRWTKAVIYDCTLTYSIFWISCQNYSSCSTFVGRMPWRVLDFLCFSIDTKAGRGHELKVWCVTLFPAGPL